MYDLIIVGGGFAGIYSGWRLAKAGLKVAIVDQASALGGTMRSQEKLGYLVDIGTHNLDLRTERSAEFYEDILGSNLAVLTNYEWGTTLGQSHTIGLEGPDFSQAGPEHCSKVLSEIIGSDPDLSSATGYLDLVQKKFGPTLSGQLKPMIEKFIGSEPATLDVTAAGNLGVFSRVRLGSDAEMALLKAQSSRLDSALSVTLAHPDPRFQGKSVIKRFGYPARGALQAFCDAAEARLRALNVDIYLSAIITSFDASSNSAQVRIGRNTISARKILWTLPDASLTRMLGLDLDLTSTFVPVGAAVHIFEVQQSDIIGPAYLHDFSTERVCYRYARQGCYSNQVTDEGKTFVLAEIPCHPKNNAYCATLRDSAWSNLIDAAYLRPDANLLRHEVMQYPVAYTLPALGWQQKVATADSTFEAHFRNLMRIPFGHRGRDNFMSYFETSIEPRIVGAR